MNRILLVLINVISLSLIAQNTSPSLLFDSYPLYEYCNGIIEKDNSELVFLQSFHNYPEWDTTLADLIESDKKLAKTMSFLWTYGTDGSVKNILPIQNSDSLLFYGVSLNQLSNNKYAVTGEVSQVDPVSYNLFIAVINEELDSIEKIVTINKSYSQYCHDAWEKSNGNILINYGSYYNNDLVESLMEVDLNGGIIYDYFYFHNGVYTNDESDIGNSFMLNDNFYHSLNLREGMVKIDNNFNFSMDTSSTRHYLSYGGVTMGSSILINGYGPILYQVFDSDSVIQLYNDTTFNGNETGDSWSVSTISYTDLHHIYFTMSSHSSGSLLIYCVNAVGQLQWKKRVYLADYNLNAFTYNTHQSGIATKDKGYLLTFGVRDTFGYADTYMLKFDIDGNTQDIFTGIKDRDNPLFVVSDFNIYPNPVKDIINIESLNYKEEMHIQVYNLDGKLLATKDFKNATSIDVSDFTAGFYFYKMSTSNGDLLEEGKFVKR